MFSLRFWALSVSWIDPMSCALMSYIRPLFWLWWVEFFPASIHDSESHENYPSSPRASTWFKHTVLFKITLTAAFQSTHRLAGTFYIKVEKLLPCWDYIFESKWTGWKLRDSHGSGPKTTPALLHLVTACSLHVMHRNAKTRFVRKCVILILN